MNKPTMSPELQAMVAVEVALTAITDDDAKGRVLRWAAARFSVSLPSGTGGGGAAHAQGVPNQPGVTAAATGGDPAAFETVAEFYDAAAPTTDAEKALVISYWKQCHEGLPDLDTQSVNSELKNLGHGISNITRAFDALKAEKPSSIIQTRKEGTSKQARKKFKVTEVGKKRVERMIVGVPD